MAFDQFEAKWLTNPPSKVADPLLAGVHPYQCVSFVKQGLQEIDGLNLSNSWWGNAIDYWRKPNPAFLAKRALVATQDVHRGDVVILKTAGYTGDPNNDPGEGHIGWATGNQNTSQFELLEQNGSTGVGDGGFGDCIRTRWVNKSRIAGVLRESAPLGPQFEVKAASGQFTSHGNLWNLDLPNFEAIVASPVSGAPDGPFTIQATLKRSDLMQYTYLLPDANVRRGYNQADCSVYTPPPPYKAPPGAATVPTSLDPYPVVVDVPGYTGATDAANDTNQKVTVPIGEYMKFTEKYGMINVTKVQGQAGAWINPKDNHIPPPPPPEPPKSKPYLGPREPSPPEVVPVEVKPIPPEADTSWKATFTSFYPNSRKPIRYVFLQDYAMKDLGESGEPMNCKKYSEISLYGTFLKDGIEYARPKRRDDTYFKFFYGIPVTNKDGHDAGIIEPEQALYNPETTIDERKNFKTLTLHDREVLAIATVEKYVEPVFKLIDGIVRKKK